MTRPRRPHREAQRSRRSRRWPASSCATTASSRSPASTSRSRAARSTRSSARTAPARRPSCGSSPASSSPTPAASGSRGQPVTVGDVEAAYRLGIAMVHQHFMLFPSLTVAENLTLGREPEHRGLFDAAAAERAVVELGERYGLRGRPAAAHRRALGRRPPARGDPARALPRRRAAHPRRADRRPDAAGGRGPVPRHRASCATRARRRSSSATSSTRSCAIADRITVLRDGRVTGSRAATRRPRPRSSRG